MKACPDIDPLLTRFVDGEAGPADAGTVAQHLDRCPPCRHWASVERAARTVLRERGEHLVTSAPPDLRRVCRRGAGTRGRWSRAGWPAAMAASLLLAITGAWVYSAFINPAVAAAAQLTLDHLKCFSLFDQPAGLHAAEVRDALRARHGWDIPIPDRPGAELTLVGGRHCVYLDGSVAHLLYKQRGVPVSVFVLPAGATLHRAQVDVMGHSAVAFERGGRTWVVLARQPVSRVQAMASGFQGD